jgi:hypothetical protein
VELSVEQQIDGLKNVAMNSTDPDARRKIVDTLAGYGDKAIPAISEIISDALSKEIREYGLAVIKKLKEK